MSKFTPIIILLLALALVACASNDTTATTEEFESESVEIEVVEKEVVESEEAETALEASSTTLPTDTAEPEEKSQPVALEGDQMACNVVGLLPPLDPTQAALFPGVTENEWSIGPQDAGVTIVEYSDFQ